jgi:hypothetical protein
MRDATRTRTRGITVATIVLAGATLGAWYHGRRCESPTLAKSFEADPADWRDDDNVSDCHGIAMRLDGEAVLRPYRR